MTSVRENIMARMATDMATIKTSAGYSTTVKTVQRWLIAPAIDDLQFDDFPLVIIEEGDEVSEYLPGQNSMTQIGFNIFACISGGASPASPTTLNAFIADIQKCIEADNTMNGYAIDTTITAITIEIGQKLPNHGIARMRVEASYYHATATP